MNIETIKMDPNAARKKLKAYRAAAHAKTDQEYQAAIRGYQALAKGTSLLSLREVFWNCAVDEQKRPRLAVARADQKEVMASRYMWGPRFSGRLSNREVTFCPSGREHTRVQVGLRTVVDLGPDNAANKRADGYAMVPMVPPEVMPKYSLRNYHVLFEVERWASSSRNARPDRDPYLLKHLGGDLWAIMGAWNLTDLERAIMAGRTAT